MSSSPNDAGIPILTEIIAASAEQEDEAATDLTALVAVSSNHPLAAQELSTRLEQVPEVSDMEFPTNDVDWGRLEHEVSEKVLRQLFQKIDAVLEQQIRDRLADVLQIAIEDMTNHVRSGLQETLHSVIKRAVSDELTRMKNFD